MASYEEWFGEGYLERYAYRDAKEPEVHDDDVLGNFAGEPYSSEGQRPSVVGRNREDT